MVELVVLRVVGVVILVAVGVSLIVLIVGLGDFVERDRRRRDKG